jgi:hypothetical protein
LRFVPPVRRRLPLVAVAVLVAVGSALLFAVLWMNAGDRHPMLAVAARVSAGEVIDAADVAVVRVSIDPGLHPLPASAREQVVGRRAAVDLVAGTLLTDAHVGAGSPVAAGRAVVGVALGPGRVPASRLQAGDHMQVVQTLPFAGDPSASGDDLGRVLCDATVIAVASGSDELAAGSTVVTLEVAETDAAAVAGAAAAEQLSLVQVATP